MRRMVVVHALGVVLLLCPSSGLSAAEQPASNDQAFKKANEDYQRELEQLVNTTGDTRDSCTEAILIAVKDSDVQRLFIKKVVAGHPFVGVRCLDAPGVPEAEGVFFQFACKPGTVCLIPPSFLAVVNVMAGEVERIVDPYHPGVTRLGKPSEKAEGAKGVDVSLDVHAEQQGDKFCIWGRVCVKVKVHLPFCKNATLFDACADTPRLCVSKKRPEASVEFKLGGISVKAEAKYEPPKRVCLKVSGKVVGYGFDTGWHCTDL